MIPSGDFDGDGAADLLSFEFPATDPAALTTPSPRLVSLLRGRDGAVLWTRELSGRVLPAPLGPQGRQGVAAIEGPQAGDECKGVCLVAHTTIGSASTEHRPNGRAVVLGALDAGGQDVWSREFQPGVGADVLLSLHRDETGAAEEKASRYEDQPEFGGMLQATPGPALDFVVGLLDRQEAAGQAAATTTAMVVDGGDGSTRATVEVTTASRQPVAFAAGDLDGDGLDDFVLTHAPLTGRITAYRGTDAAPFWTTPAAFVPAYAAVSSLGDLDEDGRAELLVEGADRFLNADDSLWILDGATGGLRLQLPEGDILHVAGDVDGNGRSELLHQEIVFQEGQGWQARYTLLDLDGDVVASRTYTYQGEVRSGGTMGDLDGDGIADAAHRVSPSLAVAVSGRTLEPVIEGDLGAPLGASLDQVEDEEGDDLVLVRAGTGATLVVTAQDGADGRGLWTRQLPVPPGLAMSTLQSSVTAADANADGVPDVVLNLQLEEDDPPTITNLFGLLSDPERVVLAWVLDGRNGAPFWEA